MPRIIEIRKRARLVARRLPGTTDTFVRIHNSGSIDLSIAMASYADDAASAFAYRSWDLMPGHTWQKRIKQPADRVYVRRNSRFWADQRNGEVTVRVNFRKAPPNDA